ncbi:MAG: response regulator [Candidatus Acidiferrales bacterium]
MRLLVAENDAALGTFLCRGLDAEHYAVDLAADGEEAERLTDEHDYDLVILDLSLPRRDGMEVLKHVRAHQAHPPILILTGRARLEDRVRALDQGADDCLLKPFAYSELSARVRALLRRSNHRIDSVLRVEDLEIDRIERTTKRAGRTIELTPKEFALLEYLARNTGRRVTRPMIIEHVWNLSFDTMTNVVDVYINYQGNNAVNSIQLSNGQTAQINSPGTQLFTNAAGDAFGALNQLLTALQTGNGIVAANAALGQAFTTLNTSRVFFGNTLRQVQETDSFLASDKLQLNIQGNQIAGADLAAATAHLATTQVALQALLEAAGKTLGQGSLLDFIK